jgi:hypothetical protein
MGTEKGNKIVADFADVVGKRPGLAMTRTSISRNVFELTGPINCLLYLKARAEYPLRWGVTSNVLDRLKQYNKPWVVVLLYVSYKTGYLLSSSDVEHYTKNIWALGADGDYKPSPGSYLANNKPFHSVDEFSAQLSTIVAKPFSIETALEDAKEETLRVRKYGEAESEAHRQLKNYVASHPDSVGLDTVTSVSVEYLFPSGDQVDVAFESAGNRWTVVEVELEGMTQTFVGLLQSVKYKALQEAILRIKNIKGSVDSILVARSIPSQIKLLAEILKIRTFEIEI